MFHMKGFFSFRISLWSYKIVSVTIILKIFLFFNIICRRLYDGITLLMLLLSGKSFFLKIHFFPPWPPWLNINRKFLECFKSVCRMKFYFIVSVFSFWRILYAYLSKNWTVAFFDVRQINFGFEHIRRQVLQTYRKKIDILWTVCTLYLRLTFLLNLFLCFSLVYRGLNHFHSCILMSGELYMQRSSVFTSFPMAASYWFGGQCMWSGLVVSGEILSY